MEFLFFNAVKPIYPFLIKASAFVLLVALAIIVYWNGAKTSAQKVNSDMYAFDQSAYMNFTGILYDRIHGTDYRLRLNEDFSRLPLTHDGNRLFLYPLLQLVSYEPRITDDIFFRRGKIANVFLSIFLLCVIAVVFFRSLPFIVALNTLLVVMFTVYIFKAGYYQVELLFYTMKFLCFVMMSSLLAKPTFFRGILTGCSLAVAQMTKYAMLINIFLFILIGLIYCCIRINQFNIRAKGGLLYWKILKETCIPYVSLVLAFFTLLSPHLVENINIFGKPFYNVNSTFYMWYDSWDEAVNGTNAHGDRVGWPQMNSDEIPSLKKYVSEHSWQQILSRFDAGFKTILFLSKTSYGWFPYLLFYGTLLCLLSLSEPTAVKRYLLKRKLLAFFVFLYFLIDLLLIAWWLPFGGPHPRYLLPIVLPIFFVFAIIPSQVFVESKTPRKIFLWAHYLLLFVLLVDIMDILGNRILVINGAS